MNCKNCNSDKVTLFHDKVWSIDNGKVYKCSSCELVFISPMMTDNEEKEFYKNELHRDSLTYHTLFNNNENLEKFARERFKMKKANEDVFIIVKED